jgi:hypothetical protein
MQGEGVSLQGITKSSLNKKSPGGLNQNISGEDPLIK